MDNQIVISAYKSKQKDMIWVRDFKNVRMYEKPIDLPNVGRESHTYLSHIIKNYDCLPPVTLFVQDDLFNHIEYSEYKGIVNLINENKHVEFKQFGFVKSLADVRNYEHYFKQVFFSEKKLVDKSIKNVKIFNSEFWTKIEASDCGLIYDDYLLNLKAYPSCFPCKFGSIFCVSNDIVRNKPLDWYKYLISLVDWDINPLAGHFFERSWPFIFGVETIPFEMKAI